MLLIEQQGPFTKGIFKNHGDEKSCRALRYKLNYGCQVNWENESAIDVAATLKVGKVLASSMYGMETGMGFLNDDDPRIIIDLWH